MNATMVAPELDMLFNVDPGLDQPGQESGSVSSALDRVCSSFPLRCRMISGNVHTSCQPKDSQFTLWGCAIERGELDCEVLGPACNIGCGSRPCTPGEHQHRWYMGVHPPQNGGIGYDPWPLDFGVGPSMQCQYTCGAIQAIYG